MFLVFIDILQIGVKLSSPIRGAEHIKIIAFNKTLQPGSLRTQTEKICMKIHQASTC